MKLFLNNVIKGLLVSLLVITLGGFLYISISKPEEINLKLISSSVVNQLVTETKSENDPKKETENNENKILVEDVKEVIKEELLEDKTSEDKKEIETPKTEEAPETAEAPETSEEAPKVESKKEPVSEKKDSNNSNKKPNNSQTNTPKGSYAPSAVASTVKSLKTFTGKITAYGPDCVGCSGSVAHGEYVGGGNIYYHDKTFGNIRIVAGDRSLGFGTIVRISGLKNTNSPIIAVMLDTGGEIGLNKRIYFDLLYTSQKEASYFGLQQATFDILRYGF